MAESKGFSKIFSKKVIRTKEKVLQNLGKADKTTDNTFDDHVQNLNKQQNVATRLQKELKNYCTCVKELETTKLIYGRDSSVRGDGGGRGCEVRADSTYTIPEHKTCKNCWHSKAMSEASARFYTTVAETYEEEWIGHDEMLSAVEQLQFLWDDYMLKLTDQVQSPVNNYVSKFPDVRTRIAKRGRKLVDFDSARHNYEALQNAKKKDEGKIQKAHEELNDARQIYMEMNNQMLEELPALYESRIGFMSSHFNALFSTECKFQEESAKVKTQLSDATERLSKESNVGPVLTLKYKPFTNGEIESDMMEEQHGQSKFYNLPSDRSGSSKNSDTRPTPGSSTTESPMTSPRDPHLEDMEFPRQNGNVEHETHPPSSAAPADPAPPRLSSPEEQSYEPVDLKKQSQDYAEESSDENEEYQVPPAPVTVAGQQAAPVASSRDSFSSMHSGFAPAKTAAKPSRMPPLPGSRTPSNPSLDGVGLEEEEEPVDAYQSLQVKPRPQMPAEEDNVQEAEPVVVVSQSVPVSRPAPQAPARPKVDATEQNVVPEVKPRPKAPERPTNMPVKKIEAAPQASSDDSSSDDDVFEETIEQMAANASTEDAVSPPPGFKNNADDGQGKVDPRRFSDLMKSMPEPPWEKKKQAEKEAGPDGQGEESDIWGAGSTKPEAESDGQWANFDDVWGAPTRTEAGPSKAQPVPDVISTQIVEQKETLDETEGGVIPPRSIQRNVSQDSLIKAIIEQEGQNADVQPTEIQTPNLEQLMSSFEILESELPPVIVDTVEEEVGIEASTSLVGDQSLIEIDHQEVDDDVIKHYRQGGEVIQVLSRNRSTMEDVIIIAPGSDTSDSWNTVEELDDAVELESTDDLEKFAEVARQYLDGGVQDGQEQVEEVYLDQVSSSDEEGVGDGPQVAYTDERIQQLPSQFISVVLQQEKTSDESDIKTQEDSDKKRESIADVEQHENQEENEEASDIQQSAVMIADEKYDIKEINTSDQERGMNAVKDDSDTDEEEDKSSSSDIESESSSSDSESSSSSSQPPEREGRRVRFSKENITFTFQPDRSSSSSEVESVEDELLNEEQDIKTVDAKPKAVFAISPEVLVDPKMESLVEFGTSDDKGGREPVDMGAHQRALKSRMVGKGLKELLSQIKNEPNVVITDEGRQVQDCTDTVSDDDVYVANKEEQQKRDKSRIDNQNGTKDVDTLNSVITVKSEAAAKSNEQKIDRISQDALQIHRESKVAEAVEIWEEAFDNIHDSKTVPMQKAEVPASLKTEQLEVHVVEGRKDGDFNDMPSVAVSEVPQQESIVASDTTQTFDKDHAAETALGGVEKYLIAQIEEVPIKSELEVTSNVQKHKEGSTAGNPNRLPESIVDKVKAEGQRLVKQDGNNNIPGGVESRTVVESVEMDRDAAYEEPEENQLEYIYQKPAKSKVVVEEKEIEVDPMLALQMEPLNVSTSEPKVKRNKLWKGKNKEKPEKKENVKEKTDKKENVKEKTEKKEKGKEKTDNKEKVKEKTARKENSKDKTEKKENTGSIKEKSEKKGNDKEKGTETSKSTKEDAKKAKEDRKREKEEKKRQEKEIKEAKKKEKMEKEKDEKEKKRKEKVSKPSKESKTKGKDDQDRSKENVTHQNMEDEELYESYDEEEHLYEDVPQSQIGKNEGKMHAVHVDLGAAEVKDDDDNNDGFEVQALYLAPISTNIKGRDSLETPGANDQKVTEDLSDVAETKANEYVVVERSLESSQQYAQREPEVYDDFAHAVEQQAQVYDDPTEIQNDDGKPRMFDGELLGNMKDQIYDKVSEFKNENEKDQPQIVDSDSDGEMKGRIEVEVEVYDDAVAARTISDSFQIPKIEPRPEYNSTEMSTDQEPVIYDEVQAKVHEPKPESRGSITKVALPQVDVSVDLEAQFSAENQDYDDVMERKLVETYQDVIMKSSNTNIVQSEPEENEYEELETVRRAMGIVAESPNSLSEFKDMTDKVSASKVDEKETDTDEKSETSSNRSSESDTDMHVQVSEVILSKQESSTESSKQNEKADVEENITEVLNTDVDTQDKSKTCSEDQENQPADTDQVFEDSKTELKPIASIFRKPASLRMGNRSSSSSGTANLRLSQPKKFESKPYESKMARRGSLMTDPVTNKLVRRSESAESLAEENQPLTRSLSVGSGVGMQPQEGNLDDVKKKLQSVENISETPKNLPSTNTSEKLRRADNVSEPEPNMVGISTANTVTASSRPSQWKHRVGGSLDTDTDHQNLPDTQSKLEEIDKLWKEIERRSSKDLSATKTNQHPSAARSSAGSETNEDIGSGMGIKSEQYLKDQNVGSSKQDDLLTSSSVVATKANCEALPDDTKQFAAQYVDTVINDAKRTMEKQANSEEASQTIAETKSAFHTNSEKDNAAPDIQKFALQYVTHVIDDAKKMAEGRESLEADLASVSAVNKSHPEKDNKKVKLQADVSTNRNTDFEAFDQVELPKKSEEPQPPSIKPKSPTSPLNFLNSFLQKQMKQKPETYGPNKPIILAKDKDDGLSKGNGLEQEIKAPVRRKRKNPFQYSTAEVIKSERGYSFTDNREDDTLLSEETNPESLSSESYEYVYRKKAEPKESQPKEQEDKQAWTIMIEEPQTEEQPAVNQDPPAAPVPEPEPEPVVPDPIPAAAAASAAPSAYEENEYSVAGETDDIYRVPMSNEPVDSKVPKDQAVLYKVMSTHPYVGEDTDELTFETGDAIAVIPFPDPDDQDEGWLMGIKESTGERGVFPANFTKKI